MTVDMVIRLVQALPSSERRAIVLRYGFEGEPLSPAEIGKSMKMGGKIRAGQLVDRGVRLISLAAGEEEFSYAPINELLTVAGMRVRAGLHPPSSTLQPPDSAVDRQEHTLYS